MWSAKFLPNMNHDMWASALLMEMGQHKDREKRWPGWELNTQPSALIDYRCSTDWATRSEGSRPWELKILKLRQWTCTSTRKDYIFANVGHEALIFEQTDLTDLSVMWSAKFLSHMNHMSVSRTDGNGPTQGQRKTLTRVGIEPTTFGLDHRCSTDWATRSDRSRPWSTYIWTDWTDLSVMCFTANVCKNVILPCTCACSLPWL